MSNYFSEEDERRPPNCEKPGGHRHSSLSQCRCGSSDRPVSGSPQGRRGQGKGGHTGVAGWLAPATYKVGVTGLLFYLQQILTWPRPTLPPTQEKLMQATRIYSLNYASKCSTSQTGKNTEMKMSIIFQYSIFYMCCLLSSV